MNTFLHHSVGSIVKSGKEIASIDFNEIKVTCTDYDEMCVDFDCTQGKYKDTFVNVSMNIEEAELLVFRLNQVIAKIKKSSEQ